MKATVIIPAFNEEESIGLVLSDIPRQHVDKIIVVDNNSSDRTASIAHNYGAEVVHAPKQGYGRACLAGIDYASRYHPEVAIFLDADYSDHPDEMPLLLNKIEEGFDLVIGSRTLGNTDRGALLVQARLGNRLAVFLIRLLFGMKYTDLGPFRAVRWPKLLDLNMKDKTFGWTVEMQVKAAKLRFKVAEVPVSYRTRVGISKITGTMGGTVRAGYKILFTIFKHALKD